MRAVWYCICKCYLSKQWIHKDFHALSKSIINSNENHLNKGGKCPFLSNPTKECFCLKMDSQNIGNMLEFCAKEWKKCDVYIKEKSARKRDESP
jgi:hypothetical protein